MLFNINDFVQVQLTDFGRECLREENRLVASYYPPGVVVPSLPDEDSEGFSRWQLHDLMRRLGQYVGPWINDIPFETTIKIEASESDALKSASPILAEVSAEIERATAKFPTWPTDPLHAFAVVGEEFGECQKEILQLTYEPHKSTKEDVRKEALQLAAMEIRFLMSLDRYEYSPQAQHSH